MSQPDRSLTPSISSLITPRTSIDPIDSAEVAEELVRELVARPLRYETIVIVLDHAQCSRAIITYDNTSEPDDVLGVAEIVVELALGKPVVGSILLVTVRPPSTDDVDHLDDVDRWLELDELFALTGLELIEWFVIGHGTNSPRELLGEPPRWRA